MKIKVKKGLERELKIMGMQLKYFYIWSITGVGLALFLLSLIMGLSKKESDVTVGMFIFSVFLSLIVFVVLKILFTKLSIRKSQKSSKQIIHLSNKKL